MNVEKLKYFLYQYVEYHSTGPSERIRTEDKRLLKKETDGISKKSEQKFELVIDVPQDVQPSQDNSSSRLIHIKYEIKVEAKLGGLHKSLIITAPIVIGTVTHEQQVGFRISLGPQTPEAVLTRVLTNLSLELQNQSNRSSIQSAQYPISSVYPISPVGVPPIGFPQTPSIGSQMSRMSYSPQSSFAMNPYQPSAPPIALHDFNSSAPVRPTSLFVPPSYDEACGNPQGLFNQMNHTAPPALHNIPNKS